MTGASTLAERDLAPDRVDFNAVNIRLGYAQIANHSPQELQYADEP